MSKPGHAEIYFNLHKHLFSVRMGGKVVRHCGFAFVKNPKFVVQPAGRAKVLKTKRKNVHAFVRGTLSPSLGMGVNHGMRLVAVRYNPYEAGHFMLLDGTPIYEAAWAYLDTEDNKPQMWAWIA